MKKIVWLFVTLVMVASLLFGAFGCAKEAPAPAPTPAPAPAPTPAPAPAPAPKPGVIELKFTNYAPEAGWFTDWYIEPWGRRLEDLTRGKVKVTYFHGGTLGGAKETFDIAIKGITDFGWGCIVYYPGRFPKTEVFALPFMAANTMLPTSLAIWKMFPKWFADEYPGLKMLFPVSSPGYRLYSRKQIKTIDELKGLKLGVHPKAAPTVAKVGATPVSLGFAEYYEALQRGTIEGCFSDESAADRFKYHEVAKYALNIKLYGSPCMWFMNLEKFNSLPDDVKKAIDRSSGGHGVWECCLQGMSATWESHKKLLEMGVQYYELPESEMQKAINMVQPIYDEWIADMEAKGLPGKEILAEAQEWLEYFKGYEFQY